LICPAAAQDKAKAAGESPAVAAGRKKLDAKVAVDFKDEPVLKDVLDELKNQVEGLNFHFEMGVSRNIKLTPFSGKEKTVREVLAASFQNRGLGFVIGTKDKHGSRYEGWVVITQGDQRGDDGPVQTPAKPEAKPAPAKTPAKPEAKPVPKEKPKPAPKPAKPETGSAEANEKAAASRLKFAKQFLEDGQVGDAREYCEEILKKYPTTKAAAEAKQLLVKLKN
jgi:hypothetical protein